MRILGPAAAYFGFVFGAGFVLGTLRVLWLVPRIGARFAELVESPLMFLVTLLAARWVTAHFRDSAKPRDRLAMGLTALAFLLAAEVGLGLALRGGSVRAILLDKDPVSGTVYYALLGVYAVMPWLLGSRVAPASPGMPNRRRPVGKVLVGILFNVVLFGSLLFGPAPTWAWERAWVFLGVVFVVSIASTVPLLNSPELLRERFKPPLQRGQPLADKLLLPLFVGEFCGVTLCIPLDVFRWHLLPRPHPFTSAAGLVLFVAGWGIISLALRENAFAAPVVRHQAERRHTVIDTGLYGIVRHPMYAGFIPVVIGMPLWLGSSAAALLALLPIATIVLRARVEEAFLRRELPGYAAYMARVRHRFIPFLW